VLLGSYTPPRPIFLPSTAFSTNAGRNRLLTLPLGNSTQENEVFEDPREKWLRLCGTINPKSDHGIGCAGAVVGYLAGTGAEVEEDSWSGTHSVIKKIEGFSLYVIFFFFFSSLFWRDFITSITFSFPKITSIFHLTRDGFMHLNPDVLA